MKWTEVVGESVLNELFDGGAAVHWSAQDGNRWKGTFEAAGMPYKIHFEHYGEGEWDIAFALNRAEAAKRGFETNTQYGNIGTAGTKSPAVFASVIRAIEELVELEEPTVLAFTGDKQDGRDGLYKAIIKRMAPKLKAAGFKLGSAQDASGSFRPATMYRLVREQRVDELFQGRGADIDWEEQSPEKWMGEFTVGNIAYYLSIYLTDEAQDVWTLEFAAQSASLHYNNAKVSPFGNTGSSNVKDPQTNKTSAVKSPEVFTTVINGVREFFQDQDPNAVYFTGSKSDGRDMLYGKILKKLRGELHDYEISAGDGEGQSIYLIHRKGMPVPRVYEDLAETSTAGGTGASSVATSVGGLGGGFDPNGHWGIYEPAKKTGKKKKPILMRR